MKKKIRLFGDKQCEDCIRMRNITANADLITLDDNIELETIMIDEEPEKTEWENVMKRTGVYFVPHMEIKWGEEEVHLSHVRDFHTTEEGFEKLKVVLSEEYKTESDKMDDVEIREKIKSLTFMQEILYGKMQSAVKNFTNIRDFINIPGSKIEL